MAAADAKRCKWGDDLMLLIVSVLLFCVSDCLFFMGCKTMQKDVNREMTIGKEWLECKSHWHYKQDHCLVLGISGTYWIHC